MVVEMPIDATITTEVAEEEEKVDLAEEKKAEQEVQAIVLLTDPILVEALTNLLHQEEAAVQTSQNQNVREEASFQQGYFEPILV